MHNISTEGLHFSGFHVCSNGGMYGTILTTISDISSDTLMCCSAPILSLWNPMYVYASSNSDLLSFNYCHFLVNSCSVIFNLSITIPLIRDVLLPYFNEIYLMPEYPSLKRVNTVLQASKEVGWRYVCTYVRTHLRISEHKPAKV